MSTSDRIFAPSRICINPTDLSAAWPHDGTDLGYVRNVVATCEAEQREIVAAEWGREVVDAVEGGEVWRVSFALRGASPTALASVFLGFDALGTDGWGRMIHPSATRLPGRTRAQDAVALLVEPLDPDNGPCTYLAGAIPKRAAQLDMTCALREELSYGASFVAGRAANGLSTFHGLLADLATYLDTL